MKFMTRKALAQEVLNSERFQAELAVVANKVGKGLTEARKEAYIALRALVSVQIPFFEFLFDRGLGPLHTRAWFLDVDWAALKRLQAQLDGVCAKVDDGQRAACQDLLKQPKKAA